MRSPQLLYLSLVLAARSSFCVNTNAPTSFVTETDPEALILDLLDWLNENGAYINPKLVVKRLIPDDASSHGVFATDFLDAGETVMKIPFSLILKPSDDLQKEKAREQTHCGTIHAVVEALSTDEPNAYGRYLLAQRRDYTPPFWSPEAQDLLMDMIETQRVDYSTEFDELPPHGVDELLTEEIMEECGGDLTNDSLFRHAAMLVLARADYQYLVPFYDMMNHNNARTNVRHLYNPYVDPIDETGYEIVTTKPVRAGEELYVSYNQCPSVCDDNRDWIGTPELFLHFGFVEATPQRWLIDFARVKFELDWKEGEFVVNFLVPPSAKGIELLQIEATRLKNFSKMYRSEETRLDEEIPTSEWELLWQYYDALHSAISLAIQQSRGILSNDVWKMGDDWWIQHGTLNAADTNEHWVYPTINA